MYPIKIFEKIKNRTEKYSNELNNDNYGDISYPNYHKKKNVSMIQRIKSMYHSPNPSRTNSNTNNNINTNLTTNRSNRDILNQQNIIFNKKKKINKKGKNKLENKNKEAEDNHEQINDEDPLNNNTLIQGIKL